MGYLLSKCDVGISRNIQSDTEIPGEGDILHLSSNMLSGTK